MNDSLSALIEKAPALNASTPVALQGSEVQAIRGVIGEQLDALLRSEFSQALALTTGPVDGQIWAQDASSPIGRYRSAEFLGLRRIRGMILQDVLVTDADGRSVRARYDMRRAADGRWKIAECLILAA